MSRGRPVDPNSKRSRILAWWKHLEQDKKVKLRDLTPAARAYHSKQLGVSAAYMYSIIEQAHRKASSSKVNKPHQKPQSFTNNPHALSSKIQLLVDFVNECGGIENAKSMLDTLSLLKR